MIAIEDLNGKIDQAKDLMNTFSSSFVQDYIEEIDAKLTTIGDQIKEEVGNITGELKDLGINSSMIPDEFDEYKDIFVDVVYQVITANLLPVCLMRFHQQSKRFKKTIAL